MACLDPRHEASRDGLTNASKQAGWRHAQGTGEPQQRAKLRRTFAGLKAGECGAVHTGLRCKSFLAQVGG